MEHSVGALESEIDKLSSRLRSLGSHRLAAPLEGYDASVADAAHNLAQRLADAAAAAEATGAAGQPPAIRQVPRLRDHAVADQVAVCGRDAARALRDLTADQLVVTSEDGTKDAEALAQSILEQVREFRGALP